jgi:hypothetical protein
MNDAKYIGLDVHQATISIVQCGGHRSSQTDYREF